MPIIMAIISTARFCGSHGFINWILSAQLYFNKVTIFCFRFKRRPRHEKNQPSMDLNPGSWLVCWCWLVRDFWHASGCFEQVQKNFRDLFIRPHFRARKPSYANVCRSDLALKRLLLHLEGLLPPIIGSLFVFESLTHIKNCTR